MVFDHHDFFINKCLELLKAKPELIEEMRGTRKSEGERKPKGLVV